MTSSAHHFNTKELRFKLLRFFCNRSKLTLVAHTDAIQDEYRQTGFKDIIAMPNPVHVPSIPARQKTNERSIRITTVDRLVSVKSHEPLIDGLAVLKGVKAEWTCQIIGEGPLLGELQERCQ